MACGVLSTLLVPFFLLFLVDISVFGDLAFRGLIVVVQMRSEVS